MGPTVESSQAIHPCDKCDFDSTRYNCYAPCTFIEINGSCRCAPVIKWTARSTKKLNEQVTHFKSLTTQTAKAAATKENGVKKEIYPFHEDCACGCLLRLFRHLSD